MCAWNLNDESGKVDRKLGRVGRDREKRIRRKKLGGECWGGGGGEEGER